jgi:pimeloyl-ACP methyl ester carboxylesterase
MVSGLVLLFVCPLPKAQTSITPAMGGEYVDVGGSKIWYEECGPSAPGPTVVLLHDGLVHSITWDAVWAPLCSRYHVLRYDRRGYGRSEPAKTPFVPEDDLSKIMRRVHVDRAMIVGNSSGGGLALDFALAHPEMVEALFLIGPVVHGMPSSDYSTSGAVRTVRPWLMAM